MTIPKPLSDQQITPLSRNTHQFLVVVLIINVSPLPLQPNVHGTHMHFVKKGIVSHPA